MDKETNIASALIIIKKRNISGISQLNRLLSGFSSYIIARHGLSLPGKDFNIITLVLESELNTINSFAGKAGKIPGVSIKIILQKTNYDEI